MPRPKNPTPSYLLHQKSGQARVRIKVGSRYRDIYLGQYGSPDSLEKYHRVLAEYFGANGNGQIPTVRVTDEDDWTVAALAVKYDDFASTHYVKDGEPTDERYRAVIPPLVRLYGNTLAREFGPKKLKALREQIIRRGNVRTAKFDDQGNLLRPGKPLGREYVLTAVQNCGAGRLKFAALGE